MPMRTIGYQPEIPEEDQEAIGDRIDVVLRPQERQQGVTAEGISNIDMFGEYIDWPSEHPLTTS